MTYTPLAYNTASIEGVDVNAVYTPATTTATGYVPEYPAPPFVAGTVSAAGNNVSAWVFAQAGAAVVSKGDVVVLSTANAASSITSTIAATAGFGMQLGVAMATATTAQFLWVQTRGQNQYIGIVAGSTAGVPLYTIATAGKITSTGATGSNYNVYGIVLFTAASTTNAYAPGNLTSIELGLTATGTYGLSANAF